MDSQDLLFIESDDATELTDKPHCGDCQVQSTEVRTDKPHCGDCQIG